MSDRPTDPNIKMPRIGPGENRLPPKLGKDEPLKADKKPSKSDDAKILERARRRFTACADAEAENRREGLADDQFRAGKQWPADIQAQRNSDGRPCLTINKLPTFLNQVTNEQRMNRPVINVSPVGDRSDVEVAKMYRGLIRFFERQSHADVAYDTAFESAAGKGFGYWRTITEYESPDSFDQTLVVKRIRNAFSVYLDPACQEQDGADAKYAFVTEMMPRKEFEETYPKADPMSWTEAGTGETFKHWIDSKSVRIAEYFEIDYERKPLVALSNGHIGWKDDLDAKVLADIADGKLEIISERVSEQAVVKWFKLTCMDVLERRDWPGKWIPITRVVGNEIDIEGKVQLSGIVRNARDAQRSYNYAAPLALDTPIPTPDGWSTMGAMKAGDRVFDETGTVCNVLGTSPTYLRRHCFRVSFDDGSSIVADAGHQWRVERRHSQFVDERRWSQETVSTEQLLAGLDLIYSTKPLDLPDADLPIQPYLLGHWLGDGTSLDVELTPGDEDIEEVRDLLTGLGLNVGQIRRYQGRAGKISVLGQRHHFARLGLIGNKHIPAAYLRASRRQRQALLQGLMDSDGTISKTRHCAYTTVRQEIRDGVADLLRGLGIKAKLERIAARIAKFANYESECQPAFRFGFTCGPDDEVFLLKRKRDRQHVGRPQQPRRTKRIAVKSVVPVPSVPVKCIKVDNESHLFLAGPSMIPTHNTMEMETIALAPKAPFVGAEGQFEGHEDTWKQANTKSYPYLEYNPKSLNGALLPPPQRQPPSLPQAGWEQLKQGAAQDMMATTGIRFDATLQERVVDESGRALRELKRGSDMGSYHYVDNLSRSLKHQGDIFLDLIPRVLDTKRIVTILREDDEEEQVQLDPNAQEAYQEHRSPTTGKVLKIFNPTIGKYGVTVTTGPSYATKRIEAAESMMDFVRALPNTAQFIADLVAKNQDWPQAEQISSRLAKMLPPQLLQPDMKDVSPQLQAVLHQMDAQVKDLQQKLAIASRELVEKDKDRAIRIDEINKNFEVKLLALVQKSESNFVTHVGSQIKQLGTDVASLIKQLASGKVEQAAGAALETMQPPPQPSQMNGQPPAPAGQGVPNA